MDAETAKKLEVVKNVELDAATERTKPDAESGKGLGDVDSKNSDGQMSTMSKGSGASRSSSISEDEDDDDDVDAHDHHDDDDDGGGDSSSSSDSGKSTQSTSKPKVPTKESDAPKRRKSKKDKKRAKKRKAKKARKRKPSVSSGKTVLDRTETDKRLRVSLTKEPHERLNELVRIGCKLRHGLYFEPKELHNLLDDSIASFMTRSTLDEVTSPVVVIGDIHGCYRTLFNIFELFGWPGTTNHLFLGDYVDRGKHSLEVMTLLFCAQLVYPYNFHLLRGNHETLTVNGIYGFKEELIRVYEEKEGVKLWEHFNETFNHMPICGLVNGKVLCMHGGLSPELSSLDDVREIERPLVPNPRNSPLAHDLMWADPFKAECSTVYRDLIRKPAAPAPAVNEKRGMLAGLCAKGKQQKKQSVVQPEPEPEEDRFVKNRKRLTSWAFNKMAVHETLDRLGVDMMVRAHEVQPFGYKFFAGKRLVTIFSRANYDTSHNYGAIASVDDDNQMTLHVMKPKGTNMYPVVTNRPPSTHFSNKSTKSK